jgi:hypothetical protein
MLTANIAGPIELILQLAAFPHSILDKERYIDPATTFLAINLLRNCLVESSRDYLPEHFRTASYRIADIRSISNADEVATNPQIHVAYSGEASPVKKGGGSVHSHRVRIISAASSENDAMLNRDFALGVIEYGLSNNHLGFVGYKWTGGLSTLGKTSANYDVKTNIYSCSGTLLINLVNYPPSTGVPV